MNVKISMGINLADVLTVEATIGDGSVSGIYLKVFLPTDSDPHSNNRIRLPAVSIPVEVERFYTLPTGSAPRIEVDATAGNAGLPVSVSASVATGDGQTIPAIVAGVTGETLSLSVA